MDQNLIAITEINENIPNSNISQKIMENCFYDYLKLEHNETK